MVPAPSQRSSGGGGASSRPVSAAGDLAISADTRAPRLSAAVDGGGSVGGGGGRETGSSGQEKAEVMVLTRSAARDKFVARHSSFKCGLLIMLRL
eukprot:4709350-Prymnesium_polylepis.1